MNTTKNVASEEKVIHEIVHALNATIHETTTPGTHSYLMHAMKYLEDQLRQLYGVEEASELLERTIAAHPELAHQTHRLQLERGVVCEEAHRMIMALEEPYSPSDDSLPAMMKHLRKLIAGILQHEHHERVFLVESVIVDRGGEA